MTLYGLTITEKIFKNFENEIKKNTGYTTFLDGLLNHCLKTIISIRRDMFRLEIDLNEEVSKGCIQIREECKKKYWNNPEITKNAETFVQWIDAAVDEYAKQHFNKETADNQNKEVPKKEESVADVVNKGLQSGKYDDLFGGIKTEVVTEEEEEKEEPPLSEGYMRIPEDVYDDGLPYYDQDKEKGNSGALYLKELIQKTNDIRDVLASKVFGQDNAINVFVEGYFQAEILDRTNKNRIKPKATFLFAGPPGVGKTFLSENVAKLIGLPFKRFDMSEYADKEAYLSFCGSSQVYKGAKEGNVTGYVSRNPMSVLLFDEIEKAHLNVIHLFLQMLDAGRLKDNYTEEEVSFKDTIIIMTTNAGKQIYENSVSADLSKVSRKVVIDALRKDINPNTGAPYFPAAICSRFASGNVILFNHMETHNLISIVKSELQKSARVFRDEYDMSFLFEDNVYSALLFAEGGNTDARTIRGRAETFFKNEILELFRLVCSESNEGKIENVKDIIFKVDIEDSEDDIKKLFSNESDIDVLVLSEDISSEAINEKMSGCNITVADNYSEALDIINKKDIAMVLIDFSCKKIDKPYMNVEDIDSDGRKLFLYLSKQMEELPVYILETDNFKLSREEKITFSKLGARAVLTYNSEDMDGFVEAMDKLSLESYQHRNTMELVKSGKVVTYKTAQIISENSEVAEILLFDFKKEQAIESEDSNQIVSNMSKPDKKFVDVIGAEDAKEELKYFVEYLKNPRSISNLGARQPRGVLLYGPPGTGKTLLAKATAGESDVTFISAVGSQFIKSYHGEGGAAIKRLFNVARKYAPTIIFIDEIDAIAMNRNEAKNEAAQEILNTLLTEMDGFSGNSGRPVFILAATNFAVQAGRGQRSLDPALVRRFDRKIYVDLPNREERKRYIQLMNNKSSNALNLSDEKMDNIAMRSAGMSLAELENIVELSLRDAARMNSSVVSDEIFEEAFETYNSGEKKKWSEESIKRTARHEAGHAFLCWEGGETPSYLTIVARDNHGGYMQHADNEDKGVYTKSDLINRIRVSLGGRAAEMVYYGDEGYSSGASSDLQNATHIARLMLCNYGMVTDFGIATIDSSDPAMESEIRKHVNAMLEKELSHCIDTIKNNKDKFERLVDALIEKNHLTDKHMDEILEQ